MTFAETKFKILLTFVMIFISVDLSLEAVLLHLSNFSMVSFIAETKFGNDFYLCCFVIRDCFVTSQ